MDSRKIHSHALKAHPQDSPRQRPGFTRQQSLRPVRAKHFIITLLLLTTSLFSSPAAELSRAEAEGQRVVEELLSQVPVKDSTVTGVLKTRGPKGKRMDIPVRCRIVVSNDNWQTVYETLPNTNSLTDVFSFTRPMDGITNAYELNGARVNGSETFEPFAGSDFWLVDLGLEFLRWPQQRLLKKELRKGQSCYVLESANPGDTGYQRVVSWIDIDTGGVIYAEAYDRKNRRIKEFDVKRVKKVNGIWQLQEVQMRNLQNDSRTNLEFDLIPEEKAAVNTPGARSIAPQVTESLCFEG
jgi:hypothetical protein